MANKRIKKKREKNITIKRYQSVLTIIDIKKELTGHQKNVLSPYRYKELQARRFNYLIGHSHLSHASNISRTITSVGGTLQSQVSQGKTGLENRYFSPILSPYQAFKNIATDLKKEIMEGFDTEQFTNKELGQAAAILKEQIKRKQTAIKLLNAKIETGPLTEAQWNNRGEIQASLAQDQYSLRIIQSRTFGYEPIPQENIDNAMYWAALKKYNELLREGMVPSLSGLEKYESAEWLLEMLPYEDIMEILEAAEEKGKDMRARAFRERMEAENSASMKIAF